MDWPFYQRDSQYRCAFTGKVLAPQRHLSKWRLPVAQLLADFPVGLITGDKSVCKNT
ncbi:MAG: hypothetical protein U1D70_15230 [Methylobacter sp.]|nr:hypothetical protein [Methylobacter sp.]MDP2426843.1 hypothetical protein [Methylobacter sp.]MDP3053561.1 hypothetical protein [Methylobacter sp.]MDP3360869.1 hypothetical protein [Methylobacter sp.]MDZ4220359.1 hypothetical protein [Methylobacter sp.]